MTDVVTAEFVGGPMDGHRVDLKYVPSNCYVPFKGAVPHVFRPTPTPPEPKPSRLHVYEINGTAWTKLGDDPVVRLEYVGVK